MLAAEWVAVTGAENRAAGANGLSALVAGGTVGRAMYPTTLGAGFEAGWAEAPGAAGSGATLQVDITLVAPAIGVCAARGAGGAAYLVAGAAAYLVFGAGDFVAARAVFGALHAEGGLVDVAGEGMGGAGGATTRGADTGTGRTDRSV